MIEPLLLIPFVENAFKHGISYIEESIVNIFLIVKEKELTFQVDNSIAMKRDAAIQIDSGIGLKNVRRRLDLLYPGKYTLLVNDNGAVYKIDLNIKFGI
jgi:two-component system LytT family sensor kinase